MDADEMNVYVEGRLPEALRARYISHLADCDRCRHLLTRLALSASPAADESGQATVATGARRSWREWLAAFFAPPVLRYAVPALALMSVMILAFVFTRERRQPDFVAQNEPAQSNSPAPTAPLKVEPDGTQAPTTGTTAVPLSQASPGRTTNSAGTENNPANPAEPSSANTSRRETATEQKPSAPQEQPKPPQNSNSNTLFNRPVGELNEVVTVTSQPAPTAPVQTSAEANAPPPIDQRRVEELPAQRSVDRVEKNKTPLPAAGAGGSAIARDQPTSSDTVTESNREAESGKREAQARRGRSSGGLMSKTAPGTDAKDDREDRGGESRTIGGRQFRRQGGTWIDTAYNSSRSIINVARGSEQYRALVGDEPGIRTIVNQLDGPIILVWKNRAYRIY